MSRLHEDVDHVAVLVHSPPQVLLPILNLDEHFVQIPGVAQLAPTSPQRAGILRPEGAASPSNRLVGDRNPALREQVFRVAEAETETVVQPDRLTDDFGRE